MQLLNVEKLYCELCRDLEQLIQRNHEEIDNQLIGDLSAINHRAECHNGISVELVEHIEGNKYSLSYSYEWHVYNGCADMDESDEVMGDVTFEIDEDGELNFHFIVSEERSTHEEF